MADAIVLDSSAIMAGLNGEPGSQAVMRAIDDDTFEILVSSVNLCEVITKLSLGGVPNAEIDAALVPFVPFCVEFDLSQARQAGMLSRQTKSLGLSLGDRACVALAISRGATAWTTDAVWKKLNVGVKIRLLRG